MVSNRHLVVFSRRIADLLLHLLLLCCNLFTHKFLDDVVECLPGDASEGGFLRGRQRLGVGIERLFLPVVMLGHLADAAEVSGRVPGGLRQVIVAGEQLRISPSIRRFFARLPACRLWNHYGPTETHVVTSSLLPPDPTAPTQIQAG